MKKIVTILIILIFIFGCTDKNPENKETPPVDPLEITPADSSDNLPDPKFGNYNLNGRAFNILVQPLGGYIVSDFEVFPELSGEPVNDAIQARNIAMEELYNCVITPIYSGTMITDARKDILAEGNAYDAIMPGLIDVSQLAGEGLLLDMYKIDTLYFDMPWWSAEACKNLSIMHRLYYTLGDLSIVDKNGMGALGFNKALITSYNLESPYQCVYNDTWTFDKFHSMCRGVNHDLNGDGIMDAEDQYGLCTDYLNAFGMVLASGEKLVSKDKEDIPYPSINNPRVIAVVDKTIQIYRDETAFGQTSIFGGHEQVNAPFMNNQILFRHTSMYRFSQVRNMESDFGFIPMPKFDEIQESYHASYSYGAPGVAIPITVSNHEETGAVIEALSYYGRLIVMPAYYEINLKTKITRDEDSPVMLDIIFSVASIDLGFVYNFGDMREMFTPFVVNNENTFPSRYAAIEPRILNEIEKLIDTFNSFS
ncbi:MAG: hypothetical protein FWF15_04140 [Oscillospiraceae bacterium]|nr:hypothetical protein [Oscillospiraceae bacterium]